MRYPLRFIAPLGILISLSACNFPTAATPAPPSPDFVRTAAAQTVEAELTRAAVGQAPTETPLPQAPTDTEPPTSLPTATATTPAPNPTDTTTPTTPTTEAPCDRAGFVKDVSIPDGTEILPGETFRKTWRLKNTGTCTWNSSYSVVFVDGDAMSGPAAAPLTSGTVPPGGEVEVSVDLRGPQNPGTYRGNWKLRNQAGALFGLGSRGESKFWVEIKVPGPTETPAPTVPPNPGFNLSFDNAHTCAGTPHATFRIENTGNVKLESAQVTVVDQNTAITLFGPATRDADFMFTPNECPPGGEEIRPGQTKLLAVSLGSSPPSGNTARATLKLCSENNLGGACLEKLVDFTIP